MGFSFDETAPWRVNDLAPLIWIFDDKSFHIKAIKVHRWREFCIINYLTHISEGKKLIIIAWCLTRASTYILKGEKKVIFSLIYSQSTFVTIVTFYRTWPLPQHIRTIFFPIHDGWWSNLDGNLSSIRNCLLWLWNESLVSFSCRHD